MIRWFEHSQVYHPSRFMAGSAADLGRPFEDLTLTASDGTTLNAWFFPANEDSSYRDWVILLCHGNAGNISTRLDMAAALLEAGPSVLMLDYRGYGKSEGKPGEDGTYQDAEAAYEWLTQRGFSERCIVPYGESLGGGIASELATRVPCGGLVLQGTFTCLVDIGAELYPWLPVRWMARIKYDTLSKLPRLRIPVLVMHSRADRLIVFRHAEKNFAAANEPKLFWEISGEHPEPLTNRVQYIEGITRFLTMVREWKGRTQAASPLPASSQVSK